MENDALYQLILNDELGWEHLITSIIREEKMNPLDIDIIRIADKFMAVALKINAIDFRFGGKFVYTAAILLKMKSDVIIDQILNRKRGGKEADTGGYVRAIPQEITVMPKLPIVRNRPITLSELIDSIRNAMRYYGKRSKISFELKLKEIKIEERIVFLLNKLAKLFEKEEMVLFSSLLTDNDRKDIIYTFLPLLFLANMNKVDLSQEVPFNEIYVKNKGVH